MNKPVIIIGAGGAGNIAYEIFRSNGVVVYGFLDDDKKPQTTIGDIPILGRTDVEDYLALIGDKCNVFVASDELELKEHMIQQLVEKQKVMPVNAIHARAQLADTVGIGHGNLIDGHVWLGAECELGHHTFIRAGSVIDHGVSIGDYTHIGAGCHIGEGARIEERTFVGTGATIVPGITVGQGARVGAGAVVVESVKAGITVFGNPAKEVKV